MAKTERLKALTEKEIREEINTIVNSLFPLAKDDVIKYEHLTFAQIGLSDLELVELVMKIEDKYNIHIPDTLAADQRFSPQDIIELVFLSAI